MTSLHESILEEYSHFMLFMQLSVNMFALILYPYNEQQSDDFMLLLDGKKRYMAILHPLESRMQQTKARAKRILFVVWILPCCVAAPFLYPSEAYSNTLHSQYGVISRLTCFIMLPENFRRAYYTFLFAFIYILPLSFIAGTCFQVARCLLKDIPVHRQGSIRRQEANRRKVAKMVLMVVLAFAVAWTPYFLVSIITQYQAVNFMERENFFFTMLCINLFAFSNSCVNPFIYAAMSNRFRNGFLRLFRFIFYLSNCSEEPANQGKSEAARNVRFKCQVPRCLATHSSSESGSGMPSDGSQRTVYTVDANHRRPGSFFKAFVKKRSSRKIIVQYVKKDRKMCPLQENDNDITLKKELLKKCKFQTRRSSSVGDLTSLRNSSAMLSFQKKCFSCLQLSPRQEYESILIKHLP